MVHQPKINREVRKYDQGILKRQEIIGKVADMAIIAFGMESAWQKAVLRDGADNATIKLNMTKLFIYTAIGTMISLGQRIMAEMETGDELETAFMELGQLCQYTPVNTIALRQEIARQVSSAGKYIV